MVMLTALLKTGLSANMGNLLRQWGHKMLERTQKRVGYGKEREVRNGRRGNKKRRNGDGIFLH